MRIACLLPALPPLLCLCCTASAVASCGSAFCPVTSGPVVAPWLSGSGSSLDLRYEYINQDQLRSGRGRATPGEESEDHTEVGTINRNLLATYIRSFASGWGVSVMLPAVRRDHRHLSGAGNAAPEPEQWTFSRIGDIRLLGRYERASTDGSTMHDAAGVTFGLKLPTGSSAIFNGNGVRAERSLQPGSGTTDAIFGAYYRRGRNEGFSWFLQGQYQRAIDAHEAFRPGAQTGLDAGMRYGLTTDIGGIVQANATNKQHDSGAQAEPDNSGSRFLFVSPGLEYVLHPTAQIYGYVQRPVYQQVNGVQLTARTSLLLGMTCRF